MKGIIFTEFLEMVEDRYGWEMSEQIIEDAALPNDGAYTAVGTYPHEELVRLVIALSQRSKTDVSDLIKAFGRHAFARFVIGYPFMFEGVTDAFDFLESIENHIHVEVRKLYPAAELPRFATQRSDNRLQMNYQSERPFADFAEGLIEGCLTYFGQPITLTRQESRADGTAAQFLLIKND